MRQAVREAAPDEPQPVVLTLDEYIAAELTVERSILRLLGWFSTIAVLLTIIGTHGIAARTVARLTVPHPAYVSAGLLLLAWRWRLRGGRRVVR